MTTEHTKTARAPARLTRRRLALMAASLAAAGIAACRPGEQAEPVAGAPQPSVQAPTTETAAGPKDARTPSTEAIAASPGVPPTAVTEPSPRATPTSIPSPPSSPRPTPTSTRQPAPTATPTPTPAPASPLSGLRGSAEIVTRRPVAVKIPNDPDSRPPTGLSQAEVVYEHETEGGITRFTAFFVLSDLDKVGPIRSARLVDVDLIREYSALFAHVGGSPGVRERLKVLGALDMDEFFYGAGGPFFRSRDRVAPHNAFVSLNKLRAAAIAEGLAPDIGLSPWPFRDSPPVSGRTKTIHIPAPPRSDPYHVRYEFQPDSGKYLRWVGGRPHVDELDKKQLQVENVIVQFTLVEPTAIVEDFLGNPSLAIHTVGKGRALIFRDGQALDGRWVRPKVTDRTSFIDDLDNPIPLRPGHTWVHLLREDQQVLAE